MKKLNINWKSIIPDIIIFVIFLIASVIYFYPALQGKVVPGVDRINAYSGRMESWSYFDQTGENAYWTNSMFGGMPTYQIGGYEYIDRKMLRPVYDICLLGGDNVFFLMLFYLVVFYCLLRSFNIDKWLSMAGAFATALSSYFFVIIAASHNAKALAITWMTLALVGFLLVYRKKYFIGALSIMLFLPIGLFRHPQMGYYICMLIGVLFFAELYLHLKEKRYRDLGISTAIFALSFAVGIGIGSANYFTNQEYAQQTMRGGHSDLQKEKDATNKVKNGLDLDYATAWSYGIDETMTLLIPDYMGRASGTNVGTNSVLYKELVDEGVPQKSAKQFSEHAPVYRGDKPFTMGPVYVGAIICFLFLLGLLIVPGPYKWALLAATLFSILLSWGRHFMPFTEFFFNYFPMYNKFRAVESILIVAEITMPLLAILAISELTKGNHSKRYLLNSVYISAGITAVVCLFFALFGKYVIDFTSSYDTNLTKQLPDFAYQAILHQRAAMLTADAWRSFAFIAAAAILIWVYIKKEFKTMYLSLALTALVIADLWPVNKRYCNNDIFVTEKQRDRVFNIQPYEKQILQDNSYFRVFNLTADPFNDARTSYRLHSIGGYHAAKLRRYQDLIDEHLSKMNWNVINMLNTKYIITSSQDGQAVPHLNPDAMGPAWFVDSLMIVNNANEESAALNYLDLHTTAVLDKEFADFAKEMVTETDANARVEITNHTPNSVEYNTESQVAKTLVCSEIYYPFGWKATIDGEPAELFRVNYMLRAVNVPAGKHHVSLRFNPESVHKGNILSMVCIIVFYLTLIVAVTVSVWRLRRKKNAA